MVAATPSRAAIRASSERTLSGSTISRVWPSRRSGSRAGSSGDRAKIEVTRQRAMAAEYRQLSSEHRICASHDEERAFGEARAAGGEAFRVEAGAPAERVTRLEPALRQDVLIIPRMVGG